MQCSLRLDKGSPLEAGFNFWKQFYINLIRCHLEFGSSVRNLYSTCYIVIVEKVQMRASKIPSKLKDMPYEERYLRHGVLHPWTKGGQEKI